MNISNRILAAVACCSMALAGMNGSLMVSALEYSQPSSYDCYDGNMGDSFVGSIGTRNGYVTVDDTVYTAGLELWIARWNFTDEQSWAWAEYDIESGDTEFKGMLSVLEQSYNKDDYDTTIEIALDGEVVYSYNAKPGFEPQEISINLSGASKIKISAYDNIASSGGTAFCIGTSAAERLGDVNLDGYVNASDASLVLSDYASRAVGNETSLSELQIIVGDVDFSESVDASDASCVLSYYAYTATGGIDSITEYLNR